MDHDQIVKELEKLDVRIADANERITRYREKVKDLEERGYKAEFERTLLRMRRLARDAVEPPGETPAAIEIDEIAGLSSRRSAAEEPKEPVQSRP